MSFRIDPKLEQIVVAKTDPAGIYDKVYWEKRLQTIEKSATEIGNVWVAVECIEEDDGTITNIR